MGGYFSSLNADIRRAEDEIEYDPRDPEGAVRTVIDRPGLDGFKWRVWLVAASGFFTTSYSIFAANVISPALNYVYPDTHNTSLVLNLTTLAGTMLGMIVFGVLADKYGRKSVYGLELTLVVVATIGMTTASTGKVSSSSSAMNIYGWIGFWRCLLGIGLGAEYPLSAVITAEWSSTRSRGTMMAAVFLMQSIGQLAAYAFGLAILVGYGSQITEQTPKDEAQRIIDIVWRLTIGIGAIPALISLFLRRIIPETPLYLAAQGKVDDAAEAAGMIYAPDAAIQPIIHREAQLNHQRSNETARTIKRRKRTLFASTSEYLTRTNNYLSQKGRWRALLGVMITWFLLDLAYYGLGLDNPRTISAIWLSDDPISDAGVQKNCVVDEAWRADPAWPCAPIYDMLKQDSIRNIITVSSGTVTGSFIILFAINYVPRTTWMGWMFVALAALFAINGGTFFVTFETDKHALTMTLYVLAQVIFNLGPNTMTFILPAELFGTKYRATFYGLAAASGKLGAIFTQVIVSQGVFQPGILAIDKNKFAGLLLGFCPAMLLGAFITWVWIPEVQFPRQYNPAQEDEEFDENASDDGLDGNPTAATFRQQLKLPNRPLEDIDRDPGNGQIIGMRRNLARLFRIKASKKETCGPHPLMREVARDGEVDERAIGNRYNTGEYDLGDGIEEQQRYH